MASFRAQGTSPADIRRWQATERDKHFGSLYAQTIYTAVLEALRKSTENENGLLVGHMMYVGQPNAHIADWLQKRIVRDFPGWNVTIRALHPNEEGMVPLRFDFVEGGAPETGL